MEAGTLGDSAQSLGRRAVRHAEAARPADRARAVGLLQVARPDVRPRGGPQRPDPRRGGRDPGPLWLVLFFTAGVIFVFMLFFADSGERAVVQGVLMGTVAAVITSMLLLSASSTSRSARSGGLRPVAMERMLDTLEEARAAIGETSPAPCTSEGRPASESAPRGGRYGATRRGDCRDSVERVPGEPLEREQAKAAAGPTLYVSSRAGAGTRQAQTEVDVATFTPGRTHTCGKSGAPNFYFRALPEGVQAGGQRLGRHEAAEEPERAADAFMMPQYRLAATTEADRLDAETERSRHRCRSYIQRSTNYVLCVVLFATALFFAGISTRFGVSRACRHPRPRLACLSRHARLAGDVPYQPLCLVRETSDAVA